MMTLTMSDFKKTTLNQLISYDEAELLAQECAFEVTISQNVFFSDSFIPIYELSRYALSWLLHPQRVFAYVSNESSENPLLQFTKTDGGWRVFSVWQKFNHTSQFSTKEIRMFLLSIVNATISDYSFSE